MSNAIERSIKTPSVYSPFLKESVISWVSWIMTCSAELFLWKPTCFSYRMPVESKWLETLIHIYSIIQNFWKYKKDGYGTISAYLVFVTRFEYRSYFNNL